MLAGEFWEYLTYFSLSLGELKGSGAILFGMGQKLDSRLRGNDIAARE